VLSTRVGYTGGDVPNATYRNHGSHAEAIEITFDPARLSYRRLLEFFFQIHDPTTLEHDRPSSLFGQFGNEQIALVAAELDRKLEELAASPMG
jgi:peptide-methionine (S)-S-oxide reductase